MTKKKKEEEAALPPLPSEVETLVVGAGPAGLAVFDADTSASKFLLESSDHVGGAALGGLHLRPATTEGATSFAPARIRWERQWTSPEEVEWGSKDWAFLAPQWKLYFGQRLELWSSTEAAAIERSPGTYRLSTPVNAAEVVGDTSRTLWRVRTPEGEIVTPNLVWAAGLTAFQNAYGKIEAQAYLTANPSYQIEAADYRGGVGLDLILSSKPTFEEGFDPGAVFGLPVRHDGKLYLCLGVFLETESGCEIRTLTHLPDERLKDSKELLSFQKSVRRTLKMITADDQLAIKSERWFVSPKIGGHALGTPWLLKSDNGLHFVGDESVGNTEAPAGAQSLGLHL